ncbi:MAG: hypothetical protein WC889_15815 [Myxococcota bacterium]
MGIWRNLDSRMKAVEVVAGLSLLCFSVSTGIAFAIMGRLIRDPGMLPAGDCGRSFTVALLHDLGYIVCTPLLALVADRLVAARRSVVVAALVAGNYLLEELLIYMSGGERALWSWPCAASGRLLAAASGAALAAAALHWLGGHRTQA